MRIRDRSFPRAGWQAIKGQIPIEAVAVNLLGDPPGRGGSRGLWWHCPFHEDRNPSFTVNPEKGLYHCFGCGAGGDVIGLAMKLEGLTFPEAKQRLASLFGLDGANVSICQRPRPAPPKAKAPPPELDPGLRQEGEALVAEAEKRLWGPKGGKALAHLRGRGLPDEAIRAARLGVVGPVAVPYKNRPGRYTTRGIAIPWFLDGRLELLKVRRPAGCDPKYHATYWGRPSLYAPFGLRPGFPLILAEGEFDAILLGWKLRDHADVATLGSASGEPDKRALRILTNAPRLFIATDGDGGGYRAGRKLAKLFPLAIRVWPPAKDWGDTHKKWPGMIAYVWGRYFPLGEPIRPEDFFDPSLYASPADERDRIEAQEEREAIQAEGEGVEGEPETIEEAESIEPIGPSLPLGGFEPEADDEAARLALATKSTGIADALEDPQMRTGSSHLEESKPTLKTTPNGTQTVASPEVESISVSPETTEDTEIPAAPQGGNDLERLDRLLGAAGFLRVDPAELDEFDYEFDPPAVDQPKPIEAPAATKARPRRSVGARSPSLFSSAS